jgi:uncharacterized peroxidase-related enzyme
MPHINVNPALPGIRALLAFRPETAAPMGALANILLRDTNGLSPAERELIATYVSYLNDCSYCDRSHGEIACNYLDGNRALIEQVRDNYETAPISNKLKALLAIAAKVREGGKAVTPSVIEEAVNHGATDLEIHDTVLIAATFCMFNRYVDGLAAITPTDMESYAARAKQVAEHGYGSHVYQAQQPVL